MKSVNRKVLMTLTGVVVAAPFLAMASVVGVHVAALADNVRADEICVALVLASVAVRIIDEHLALLRKVIQGWRGAAEPEVNTSQRARSTISSGY